MKSSDREMNRNLNRFENTTVMVTGGASGIGAATARGVADHGGSVVIVDRDPIAAKAVVDDITARGGVAAFEKVDLADCAKLSIWCEQFVARQGELHGLVNNAGIVRASALQEMSDQDWNLQLAINLTAPAYLVRGLLPALERGRASIVNISSEGAFRPRERHAAYDASKGAILSLTRSLAAELGKRHIRVNSVAPGWVVSEMHFGTGPDAEARRQALLQQNYPRAILDRLGRPEEIAAAVCFLLSTDSSYITGTCLHVDGGMGLG